ncbi:MAG: hypothetical protein K5761_02580 [Clostridiales bacterium]|nr:hypothetical protein [Clostridiales bacterium]
MSKLKLNFNSIRPFISKAETAAKQGIQSLSKLVQNRDIQKGAAMVLIPSGVSAFFLIRKYKKEAAEKDALYKEKLRKHDAIIKELSAQAEISKERQDRLLQDDSKLKEEMATLESERDALRKKIADLEEGKNE